jgi:hypothetical protein
MLNIISPEAEITRFLIIFGLLVILVFIYYLSIKLLQKASAQAEQQHKLYTASFKQNESEGNRLFLPGYSQKVKIQNNEKKNSAH